MRTPPPITVHPATRRGLKGGHRGELAVEQEGQACHARLDEGARSGEGLGNGFMNAQMWRREASKTCVSVEGIRTMMKPRHCGRRCNLEMLTERILAIARHRSSLIEWRERSTLDRRMMTCKDYTSA